MSTAFLNAAAEKICPAEKMQALLLLIFSNLLHFWRSRSAGNSQSRYIRGPVKHPQFNGKVERFFRTLKLWQRLATLHWPLGVQFIQRKLDFFREWYNNQRVHQGVHGLTPDESWAGTERPEPVRYFARDKLNPIFTVRRRHFQDDPHFLTDQSAVVSKKRATIVLAFSAGQIFSAAVLGDL